MLLIFVHVLADLIYIVTSPAYVLINNIFAGFGDRLLCEVKKLAPKDIKIRVSTYMNRLEC